MAATCLQQPAPTSGTCQQCTVHACLRPFQVMGSLKRIDHVGAILAHTQQCHCACHFCHCPIKTGNHRTQLLLTLSLLPNAPKAELNFLAITVLTPLRLKKSVTYPQKMHTVAMAAKGIADSRPFCVCVREGGREREEGREGRHQTYIVTSLYARTHAHTRSMH